MGRSLVSFRNWKKTLWLDSTSKFSLAPLSCSPQTKNDLYTLNTRKADFLTHKSCRKGKLQRPQQCCTGTHAFSFCWNAFPLRQQTMWLIEAAIFAVWHFLGKACCPLSRSWRVMREQGWHRQPRSDLQGIRGDVMISIYNFKNDENPSKDLKQGMTSTHLEVSLVVQWLGICLPVQGMRLQSLVGELRSHMPQSI